jgi:L-ascorbate metabolism protein UlaG (beta-lactamase superfamily)
MEYRGLSITHFEHDCFQIKAGGTVVYFDPFNLKAEQTLPADYIFITHEHFDHCSKNDLEKIAKPGTAIVASQECESQLKNIRAKEIIYVLPGQQIVLGDLAVATVPAYNLNKFRADNLPFHPPANHQVGYILTIGGVKIYHAGDTDNIPELANIKDIDLALLPVSGTYAMDCKEAAEAAAVIKPKIAIPMHYGSVIGSIADAEKFKVETEKLGIKTEII